MRDKGRISSEMVLELGFIGGAGVRGEVVDWSLGGLSCCNKDTANVSQ